MECKICKKECIRNSGNQKYCKDCTKIRTTLLRKRHYNKHKPKKLLTPIICKGCNKEFIRNYGTQKYCNKKCAKKYWKSYYKLHYKPRSMMFICIRCKIKFKRNNVSQKYCKPCSKINQIEYQHDYNKLYRKTKKGKMAYKKLNNKRRAKLNSIRESFTTVEWLKKVDETNGICPGYKHEPHFVGKNKLTLDHTPPISKAPKGFIYTIKDVNPLCKRCNSRKRDVITQ